MQLIDKDLLSMQEVRELVEAAKEAQQELARMDQAQVDRIVRAIADAGVRNARRLAQMANEDTGFGIVDDKVIKNIFASRGVYEHIKDMKTIGEISRDDAKRLRTIAVPVGVIAGLIPSTNPTSTALYKAEIAIKAGNAIVFSPHPTALRCILETVKVIRQAIAEAGGNENLVSCITIPTMEATDNLMRHRDVAMILATGGSAMVRAAYSSGTPAIGVGPGNGPAYLEKTCDLPLAVKRILDSKTFDNGTICASEQSVICEACNRDQVVAEFRRQGGYFMTAEETKKVCGLLFKNGHAMSAEFVGRSPQVIAAAAGIRIPEGTRVLLGEQAGVGKDDPLSYEKLTTVLGFYTVQDWREACDLSIRLLQNGIGHTMNIHTEDPKIVREFSRKPASRILVNTGGTQGGTGASTALAPAFTLGCGTWGGSATSENVTPMQLVNIKKVVYGLKDVTTLVRDDPTFRPPAGQCPSPRQAPSPAEDIGAMLDGLDSRQLAELVSEMVKVMNLGS